MPPVFPLADFPAARMSLAEWPGTEYISADQALQNIRDAPVGAAHTCVADAYFDPQGRPHGHWAPPHLVSAAGGAHASPGMRALGFLEGPTAGECAVRPHATHVWDDDPPPQEFCGGTAAAGGFAAAHQTAHTLAIGGITNPADFVHGQFS